ncbi:MAG: hypothetical protein HQ490_00870 [Lutibacter sp.]|nr:hypothetical protein [Lutibacter sp.]
MIINYTPISLFSNRFHGGKSHLRALLKGLHNNQYFIIQFGGLSKPYINYNGSERTLFINIFPYNIPPERISEEKEVDRSKIKSAVITFLKVCVSAVFNAMISSIALFNEVGYYERATKSLAFRPLFIKRKFLEINDSYISSDYKWFDVIVCVDRPNDIDQIKLFKNPWPCEVSNIYHQYKGKAMSWNEKLNLVIINTSPYGISSTNISLFIEKLMGKNVQVEIFYIGYQDELLNSLLEVNDVKINYCPIVEFESYNKLLSEMDIAFVTYGNSLDINQKRVAVPMKIMDLLAYNIKVFCDQKFKVFEKYPGIVECFDLENQQIDFTASSQVNMELFFNDVDPTNYVNRMLSI